jgi:lambda family phage portal protein
MQETGDYIDAELVAAKIAACFALFVTKQYPGANMGRMATDSSGKKLTNVEPGMIEYLQPGEQVQAAMPGRGTTTVRDFVQIEQRLSGAGMGLSYEAVSRDVSQTNYSSYRANALEDRKTYAYLQGYTIKNFCLPIRRRFVEACVLSGAVNIPGYWADPKRYQAVSWTGPGWDWVDPLDEVKASKEEIKSGLSTLAKTSAEKGEDWRENLEQMAREKKYAEKLGLTLDIYNPIEQKGEGNVDRSIKKEKA